MKNASIFPKGVKINNLNCCMKNAEVLIAGNTRRYNQIPSVLFQPRVLSIDNNIDMALNWCGIKFIAYLALFLDQKDPVR